MEMLVLGTFEPKAGAHFSKFIFFLSKLSSDQDIIQQRCIAPLPDTLKSLTIKFGENPAVLLHFLILTLYGTPFQKKQFRSAFAPKFTVMATCWEVSLQHPFRTQIEGLIPKDEPSSCKTLGFRPTPILDPYLDNRQISNFEMGHFELERTIKIKLVQKKHQVCRKVDV